MIKTIILSIVLLISQVLFGQVGFEFEYNKPGNEILRYTFETSTGDFISIGGQKSSPYPSPQPALILKINSSGNIIDELTITKSDTILILHYGYEKASGNFLLLGTLSDSPPTQYFNLTNITYVCELTPELNLVWEKFYTIPEPYNRHELENFIFDADSVLIIQGSADSSLDANDNVLMTMKLDKYGNQLALNLYDDWHNYNPTNEMIFNKDSTAIFSFGDFWTGLIVYYEFIEMDLELNIINSISVIDWEHFSSPPISLKVLHDSTFIQANQAVMEPGAYHDLYVKIMDEEFNTLRDTLLFYPGYDHIPEFKGLGFMDPNKIWVTTYNPEPNSFSGTEVFRFHIFDSNLNLMGMKLYGGDRRYSFFNTIVTSDGGCLMTGSVCDFIGSDNDNGYIIKVMPEDIITNAEETPISVDRDVIVYPNPFKNEIWFQTIRKDLTFELHDISGKKVLSGKFSDHVETKVVTGNINDGMYFYIIRDGIRNIQSGKLIKQ